MKHCLIKRIAAPLLALLVLCASCGGEAEPEAHAATMRLTKAEGTVSVTNEESAPVEPGEGLALYSGYGISTERGSRVWFEFDPAMQAKADESTRLELHKEEGLLELDLKKGSLFFNITEPLEAGEQVSILTSTMTAELRDACGWVTVDGADCSTVYLLKGTISVSCGSGGPKHISVYAGQAAAVAVDGGEARLVADAFSAGGVPGFVTAEVEQDSALAAEILAASGLDVLNPAPAPSQDPEPSPSPTVPVETGPVNLEDYEGSYFCEETGVSVELAVSFSGSYLLMTPHPTDHSYLDQYDLDINDQTLECVSPMTGQSLFTVTPRNGQLLIESTNGGQSTAYLSGLYSKISYSAPAS